jgi:hypothetical protein
MRTLFGIWLSICVAPFAHAQVAEEANLTGQPLMYMKNGQVDGCGVRLIGIVVASNLKKAEAIDGSVNVTMDGYGTVKGLSYDMIPGKAMERRNIPIERFWLKAPGSEATHPRDGQFHKTDDVGGRMYIVSVDAALQVLIAAVTDKTINVGLKRTPELRERIYFGRVEMTQGEKDQVLSCLDDLIVRLSKRR